MGGACAGVQTGGKRLHDQTLSPASMRSRSEFWCPEGLREALAPESDDLDRPKRRFQSSQEASGRHEEEEEEQEEEEGGRRKEGGGGRREEEGGRREEGGGWREEGGERRKEEGVFQTEQSAYYLFSRSLLAASTIMLEALDEQDCVLERLRRPQIDKISVLEGSRRR